MGSNGQREFRYTVTVTADSQDDADQIMAERILHDEDLREIGIGDYRIDFESNET